MPLSKGFFVWGTMRLVDRCIDSDRFTVDSFCHSGTVRPKYTYCMYALNMNLNIIDSLALFVSGREMCSARWAVLQELEMSKPIDWQITWTNVVWDSPIGPDLGFCQNPHFIQNKQLGFPSLTDQNQKLFQRGNGMDVDDFGTLLV